MPTIVIMDRDVSRRDRLVALSRRMNPEIHIEAFLKPEPASLMNFQSKFGYGSCRTMGAGKHLTRC